MNGVGGFRVFAPVAALALLAAACEETVSTAAPEGLRYEQAAVALPFHGTLDLQALGWTEPPEGRCPEGYPMLSTMAGSGRFTHLGLTSAVATHCIHPETLAFARGRMTLTAADGDELHGTYEGVTTFVEPPMAGWADVIVFAGGTGRFVSASGQVDESGEVNMVTGVGSCTMNGSLRY